MTSTSVEVTRGITIVVGTNGNRISLPPSLLDIPTDTKSQFFETFDSLTELLSHTDWDGDDDDVTSSDLFSFLKDEVMSVVYDFVLQNHNIEEVEEVWTPSFSMDDISSFLDYESTITSVRDDLEQWIVSVDRWSRKEQSKYKVMTRDLEQVYDVIKTFLCFPLNDQHHVLTITYGPEENNDRTLMVELDRLELTP